jgi:hypothetical protein
MRKSASVELNQSVDQDTSITAQERKRLRRNFTTARRMRLLRARKKLKAAVVTEELGPATPLYERRKVRCITCDELTTNYRICARCNEDDDGVMSYPDAHSDGRV